MVCVVLCDVLLVVGGVKVWMFDVWDVMLIGDVVW